MWLLKGGLSILHCCVVLFNADVCIEAFYLILKLSALTFVNFSVLSTLAMKNAWTTLVELISSMYQQHNFLGRRSVLAIEMKTTIFCEVWANGHACTQYIIIVQREACESLFTGEELEPLKVSTFGRCGIWEGRMRDFAIVNGWKLLAYNLRSVWRYGFF